MPPITQPPAPNSDGKSFSGLLLSANHGELCPGSFELGNEAVVSVGLSGDVIRRTPRRLIQQGDTKVEGGRSRGGACRCWHLHRQNSEQSAGRQAIDSLLPGNGVGGDGGMVFKCAVKR